MPVVKTALALSMLAAATGAAAQQTGIQIELVEVTR